MERGRLMRMLALTAAALVVGACNSRSEKPPAPPAIATEAPPPKRDPHLLVTGNCLSCHGEDLLMQQRLTAAQWAKVIKKMVGWGASLTPDEETVLGTYLAASYGTEAGPYSAANISTDAATAQLAVRDDGPYARGDAERGRAIFEAQCVACHGRDAHGSIGVNLANRPLLGHADAVANSVRQGRGKMPPNPSLSDAQIADLLAYLRSLP